MLRWQLRPVLASALLVAAGAALRESHAGWATLLFVLAVLCAAVAALVIYLLPPFVNLDPGTERRFQHIGFHDTEIMLSAAVLASIASDPTCRAVERPSTRFKLRVFYPAAAPGGGGDGDKGGLLAAEQTQTAAHQPTGKSTIYAEKGEWTALSQVAGVPLPPFVYSHMGEVRNRPKLP